MGVGKAAIISLAVLWNTFAQDSLHRYSYVTPVGFEELFDKQNIAGIVNGMGLDSKDTLDIFMIRWTDQKEDGRVVLDTDTIAENTDIYSTLNIPRYVNALDMLSDGPRNRIAEWVIHELIADHLPVINIYQKDIQFYIDERASTILDSILQKKYDMIFTGGHGAGLDSIFTTLGDSVSGYFLIVLPEKYWPIDKWIDLSCGTGHALDTEFSSKGETVDFNGKKIQLYERYTNQNHMYIPKALDIKRKVWKDYQRRRR